jgi:hypothetical protein
VPQMTHPDSSQTIEVSPPQVAAYESQGWEKKAARKATTTTSASTAKTKE